MRMKFQSTFPRGERRPVLVCLQYSVDFNPRSRVGNDQWKFIPKSNYTISIHVPAWGTTTSCDILFHHVYISIHVPAWGTTTQEISHCKAFSISIHVPAWGTTFSRYYWIDNIERFQSTFPRGERLDVSEDINNWLDISIHVPAWGTTWLICRIKEALEISIHVPAWGTTCINQQGRTAQKFQSTFPRGERPNSECKCSRERTKNFNPRSRVGNDSNYFQNILLYFRNNH